MVFFNHLCLCKSLKTKIIIIINIIYETAIEIHIKKYL